MSFIQILTLIGSVGLFLYGLKLMSEGLQRIFGDSLRAALTAMTKNRFTGMLTGVLVTSLVQSSSSTTVMIVSFVNAGLITLAEAMAAIMGANVGTTVTTWLVAALGFRIDISPLILPLIALALPFLNSHKSKYNSWGEMLVGFALLFMGVWVLQGAMPHISDCPVSYAFFQQCCSWGFGSVLLFLFIGILLTLLVQTSSATFLVATLLCIDGWLPFTIGCALVLGSNIGTCIMPLIASFSANTMARRAGLGHLLFNVFGVVWALALFYYFCTFVTYLCQSVGFDMVGDNMAIGLALFHTLFNCITLCLLLPFTTKLVSAITRIIPERENHQDAFKLQHINEGFMSSAGELVLAQVQKEVQRYAEETYRMFLLVRNMINEPMRSERQLELMERVKALEEDSDRAELEIAQILNQISPATLSHSGEQQSRNLYKIVDELESIADSIYHCSMSLAYKSDHRVKFNAEMNQNVAHMMELTDTALQHMVKVLSMTTVPNNAINKAYNNEDEINNFRNQMRNAMLDSIDRREVEYLQNTYFMQLVNECEKIGDYIINVISAASEK